MSAPSVPPEEPFAPGPDGRGGPTLCLDVSLYEEFLAEANLTEAQKREFLDALWSIIVGFVDLGFGVHPIQKVRDSLSVGADPSTVDLLDVVSSYEHSEKQEEQTGSRGQARPAERKES